MSVISSLLNAEYELLSTLERLRVDAVIALVMQTNERQSLEYGDWEFYAYPHPAGGVAWGINDPDGENYRRGIAP